MLLFTVWFTTQSLHQAFQKGFTFTMIILLIALILHLLLVSIAITAVIFDAKSVRKLERKAKPPTNNSQNVQWKQFPDDIYHFPVLDLRNYRVIRDDNTDRAHGGNALPDRPQIDCSVRRKSMAEAPTNGPKTVCLNMKTDADEDVLQWMDAAEGLPTVHDHYSIDETSPAPPSSSKPSTSLTPSSSSKPKQSTSYDQEEKRPNHSLIISISPGTCPDILTGTTASTDDETDDDDDYVDVVDFRKPDDEQSSKTEHSEVNIDVEKLEQEMVDFGEDLVRRNSEYGIERTTC
uniref:Uncharacterized protein n=1 Tax=Bursaphelenchus xylophilus TaxID=6326 RepID=A0A1I7SI33_BURXY